ncbi:hypothetical protein FH972_019221 [Carpinus fangiana]|uniref:Uncharacterized protein n=1 Tax=Carpinus fangiana TaxID=176857 RepID=A0A5N6RSZ9_9ROSI|nr:hypothetical protein FH972_019221 [Carpinus fangiana]
MKKKKLELADDDHDHEILKAVAQAWHGHSRSSRPTNEFDAYRRNFKGNPSRFKLQAMISRASGKDSMGSARWDFGQSLCDSYEIVTLSRRLEAGLLSDDPFTGSDSPSRVHRRRRESRHSLRSLFNHISSRRFNEADIPRQN